MDLSTDLHLRQTVAEAIRALQPPPRVRHFPYVFANGTALGDLVDLELALTHGTLPALRPCTVMEAGIAGEDDGEDDGEEEEEEEGGVARGLKQQHLQEVLSQLRAPTTPVAADSGSDSGVPTTTTPSTTLSASLKLTTSNASDIPPLPPPFAFEELHAQLNAYGKTTQFVENLARSLYSWWYGVHSHLPAATAAVRRSSEAAAEAASPAHSQYLLVFTNWLWRPQLRILQLDTHELRRIHPYTNVVRTRRAYTDITSFIFNGDTLMTIRYHTPPAAEHYELAPADRARFVEEVCARSGRSIPLVALATDS